MILRNKKPFIVLLQICQTCLSKFRLISRLVIETGLCYVIPLAFYPPPSPPPPGQTACKHFANSVRVLYVNFYKHYAIPSSTHTAQQAIVYSKGHSKHREERFLVRVQQTKNKKTKREKM